MTTSMKIVRFVGIAGLLGWLAMVGWAAKTSQAQNGNQDPPPISMPEMENAATTPTAPPPIVDDALSLSPDLPPPAIDDAKSDDKSKKIARANDDLLPSLSDAVAVNELPSAAPDASDDPEKAAQVFAERNQREAESRLLALTTEAERLRERLRKLETGIKRWENVVSALKASQQEGEITSNAAKTAKGTWSAATEKKGASTTKPVAATTPKPAHTNPPQTPRVTTATGGTGAQITEAQPAAAAPPTAQPVAAPAVVATPLPVQPPAPVAPAPVQAVYPAPVAR